MNTYNKTVYTEYEYFYFDGSNTTADIIKRRFDGYCRSVQIHHFNESYHNWGGAVSYIEINNSGLLHSNYINVNKGDYLLYSKNSQLFNIKTSLENYIITDNSHCKKPRVLTFSYEKFCLDIPLIEKFISDFKNVVDYIAFSLDTMKLKVMPKYGDKKELYLDNGDYLVKTENSQLFVVHSEKELEEILGE